MADTWEWKYGLGNTKVVICPTCNACFNLDYIKPYRVEDLRHCPNCGERLEPPEECS